MLAHLKRITWDGGVDDEISTWDDGGLTLTSQSQHSKSFVSSTSNKNTTCTHRWWFFWIVKLQWATLKHPTSYNIKITRVIMSDHLFHRRNKLWSKNNVSSPMWHHMQAKPSQKIHWIFDIQIYDLSAQHFKSLVTSLHLKSPSRRPSRPYLSKCSSMIFQSASYFAT